MNYIYPKFTLDRYLKLVLLTVLFLLNSQLKAQTCTPQGNQTAYGQNQWIGYVYSNIDTANPPGNVFLSANYKGYITRTQNFDQNIGDDALPAESTLCTGTYSANFSIRYKMQKTMPAGYYTYTVNGDDGYRLSLDGGTTFNANLMDWADHGYQGKSATYYHAGGVISLVLEYFEHGGASRIAVTVADAACTSTAPTSISGNLTVSCSTSTTLTAAGGTAGTGVTYQWGKGNVAGTNTISGATTASITVQPLNNTTYWVRRVSAAPCSTTTDAAFATVTTTTPATGNPSVFGDNKWNAYVYKGEDINLGIAAEYAGFYTVTTTDAVSGFDTTASWDKAQSPSSVTGWTGCAIPVDHFTFVYKRQGFPCGRYTVRLDNWDDDIAVYINGVLKYSHTGYSGGVATPYLGNYDLSANSTIEVRVREDGGDARAKLSLVYAAPTTINGGTANIAICKNTSITLTAMGLFLAAGDEYQWGTGAVVGTNPIAGETGASITVSPTTSTRYWVRVKYGSCTNSYGSGISRGINVTAPVYYTTSGWSATPSITTPVEIQANLEITTPISACSCLVKSNASVVVDAGTTFTVKNKITVETGGTFIARNNSSIVQTDDNVVNAGNVSVIKNSNPLYRLDYTMWSSPVSGQQLNLFSIFTNPTRFYTYGGVDANGNYADIYTVANVNDNFAAATGYLIRMPNTITGGPTGTYYQGTSTLSYLGTFKGVPNNGTIYKTLNTLGNRYTAVGNPYASPISVKEFYNQNTGVLDGTSAMYFWRKKNDADVSTYATLTLAAFVANGAAPDGTTTNTPNYQFGGQDQAVYFTGSNSDNANWLIAPGQGFIVRAQANLTNPQLVFNNTMRKPASIANASFLRTAEDSQPSRFWLNLSTQTGFSQIAVAYIDGATTGLDFGYDGARLAGGGDASLYSVAADENLAIQARPAFNPSDEVALGYVASVAGQYTFAIDHKDGVFAEGQDVYLKDNFTGITHNVSAGEYNFTTDAGTFANRFSVIYMQTLGTDNPVLTSNNVIVYKQDSAINITTGNVEMTDVTVYDIRGRKLFSQTGINAAQFSITNLTAQQEVLVVEITTEKGKVSKKIVY